MRLVQPQNSRKSFRQTNNRPRRLTCLLGSTLFVMLTCAAQSAAAETTAANQGASVAAGAKVRLSAPSVSAERVQGTVIETSRESLILDADGKAPLTVPWQAITRLEVSGGTRSLSGRGLLIGVAAGAALSVVLPKCVNEGCSSDPAFDPVFATLYGLCGGVLGRLIGSNMKSEDWRSVPLRVALAPTRGRGFRVQIAISLK